MGNPIYSSKTFASTIASTPTIAANSNESFTKLSKLKPIKAQKQQHFSLKRERHFSAISQRRKRQPNSISSVANCSNSGLISTLITTTPSDLVSKATDILSPSLHSISASIKHTVPLISTLGSQIANASEILLNHITTPFADGTLSSSTGQLLHDLAMTFDNYSQTALLSSPAVSVATVLITLMGSVIAVRPSTNKKDYPFSLRELKIVKYQLARLQVRWNAISKKHRHNKQPHINGGSEEEDDSLPLHYDPKAIMDYYKKRPFLVFSRASFIVLECSLLLVNILMDVSLGKAKENESLRASQLVDLITRLGPTAVKVGQALSVRPDLLPPTYLEALQRLQDRVPPFSNAEARDMILEGLGHAVEDIYSDFSDEPIAAASLGQVYKAKLRASGETVAVKVQRPRVLDTVSLDLYILRAIAMGMQKLPNQNSSNLLSFLDHWAAHFFQELDYTQEAKNAEMFSKNMRSLPNVVVPKALMQHTSRKVLTSLWIEGTKLSESEEGDAAQIVSMALNCYLIQLLESGFLHADPHPGNLLRTPDGRLCVLDFGLMIQVTEDQRYALIDYISHLVNADYEKVSDDLIRLGFLPPHLLNHELATEILPQLSRVLSQLVRGGGLQQMDVEQIIADLMGLAKDYAIVIPPYFATILRAFSILEGIGLKSNPNYVIIDECYPYICKRLLTDDSPRARTALKYFLYGKKEQLDAQRVEGILLGFKNFRHVMMPTNETGKSQLVVSPIDPTSKEVLSSLFAPEGSFIQELLLAELVRVVDALSREAIFELWNTFVGISLPFSRFVQPTWPIPVPGLFGVSSMYTLSPEDEEALKLVRRLWKLMGSELNKQTAADMTVATHSITALIPDVAAGVTTASMRFWLMLLHRKALRFADDLDGRNSLIYWNRDPAASARHVRPLVFFPVKNAEPY